MGLLRDLFCSPPIQVCPDIPQICSVMTPKNVSDIMSGIIHSIPVKKVVLKGGEQCYFCDYAVLIISRLRVVCRRGRGGGFSFKIINGMYYHTGDHDNVAIREKIPEYFSGKLYITNKRIIFSSDTKAFQHSICSLISYRVEGSTLVLQFSNNCYRIYLPVSECAEKVIEYIL